MAELAGRVGDGINTPAGPRLADLIRTAREAHERSGRDPATFLVSVSTSPSRRERERLAELGVHRAIVPLRSPYVDGVARVRDAFDH